MNNRMNKSLLHPWSVLTWWYIVVFVDRDVVYNLQLIYSLEDSQSLANGGHAEFLEGFGVQ